MDWKEFFRPSKGKIVLFIILTILSFSIIYWILLYLQNINQNMMGISIVSHCCISEGKLEGCADEDLVQKFKTCEGYSRYMQNQEKETKIRIIKLIFLPSVVIGYLLSCTIIWIYRKIKSKKVSEK